MSCYYRIQRNKNDAISTVNGQFNLYNLENVQVHLNNNIYYPYKVCLFLMFTFQRWAIRFWIKIFIRGFISKYRVDYCFVMKIRIVPNIENFRFFNN